MSYYICWYIFLFVMYYIFVFDVCETTAFVSFEVFPSSNSDTVENLRGRSFISNDTCTITCNICTVLQLMNTKTYYIVVTEQEIKTNNIQEFKTYNLIFKT